MGKTAKFVPRLTAPSTSDKHWIHTSRGGLNDCVHISGGSVLPNCVGYAWGRFYEITDEKPRLSRGNAEDWYGNTADGYKRSATPKLGAVACWRKGKVWNSADGCGHVAIVEEIKPNGDIVCSNSAWGGTRFYMKTYSKSANYNSGTLTFQGFILPTMEFEGTGSAVTVTTTTTATKPITGNFKVGDIVQFNGAVHYKSSTSTSGVSAKPGKAKITLIAIGAANPYHLVAEKGGGSTVYGWVNAADISALGKKTIDEVALEVIRGDWGNGDERVKRLTASGYNYNEVQKRVNQMIYK